MAETQNGWLAQGPTRDYPVPGSDIVLTLTADQNAAFVMVWCASQWHSKIEPLNKSECGGYDPSRPVGGLGGTTSNHVSGTAMDLNSAKHPDATYTFSDQMKGVIHWIIQQTEGVCRWGGDWDPSSIDEMHVELDTTDQALIRRVADKLHRANPEMGPTLGTVGTDGTGMANTGVAAGGVDTNTVTIKKYPAMALTQIRNTNPVNTRGMLGRVRLGGGSYVSDVQEAVTSATMSYASSEVGELSLTMQDTDRGALQGGGYIAIGVPVSFGDQRMDIRTVETGNGQGGPEVRISARSRTIFRLRTGRQVGAGSWGPVQTTQWVKDRAAEVGARAIVQPDLYELVPMRDDGESTWDVMQKLAGLHQCWCFEYEQTIIFGQPTWLASRPQARSWQFAWRQWKSYTDGTDGVPQYRASVDAPSAAETETLTWMVWADNAYRMRPGDLVKYSGKIGDAKGYWMLTKVVLDLGGVTRVLANCTAQRVVNPAPTGTFDDPTQTDLTQSNTGGPQLAGGDPQIGAGP